MSAEALFGLRTTRRQHVISAPAGKLGLQLQSRPGCSPTVTNIAPGSPLEKLVALGWELEAVDDVNTSKMSAAEASNVLQERVSKTRALSLLQYHNVVTKRPVMSGVPIEVQAPSGWLGLQLANLPNGGSAVRGLAAASPLLQKVAPGWQLLAVDDTDVRAMDCHQVVGQLSAAAAKQRVLIFTPPPMTWCETLQAGLPFAVALCGAFLMWAYREGHGSLPNVFPQPSTGNTEQFIAPAFGYVPDEL